MQANACPICGHEDARPWRRRGRWQAVRCSGCGAGRLDPAPTGQELSDFYAHRYEQNDRAETDSARPAMRHLLDGLERRMPPGRLLDVGCGWGTFLAEARSRGWEVAGVEPTRERAQAARGQGIAVFEGRLEDAPFADASFDAVTLVHVIEHLPDPRATLDAVARLLRPGGVLYVSCPNAGSLEARLAGGGWGWFAPPVHLFHHTPASLHRLLDLAGFHVRAWSTRHGTGRCGLLYNALLGLRNRLGHDADVVEGGSRDAGAGGGRRLQGRLRGAAYRLSMALDRVVVPALATASRARPFRGFRGWAADQEAWAERAAHPVWEPHEHTPEVRHARFASAR